MSESKLYIKMSDNANFGPFWFGLVPLGDEYKITRDGQPVLLPSMDTEVVIQNIKNQDVTTTVQAIVQNAANTGIIDVLDENQKNVTEKIKAQKVQIARQRSEAQEKARVQKFLDVLEKKQDDVITYMDGMIAKFSGNPALITANLKFFRGLEEEGKNKGHRARKKVMEYLDKCIDQFEIKVANAQIKNVSGAMEDDVVNVTGINSVGG